MPYVTAAREAVRQTRAALGPFVLGPFVLGPFVLGPFALGPFALGPFAGFLGLPGWALPALGTPPPRVGTAPQGSPTPRPDSARIAELLNTIRDEAMSPRPAPFLELGRMESADGLAALKRAAGLTQAEDGYRFLFQAVQRYAGLGEIGEEAFAFVASRARSNEPVIAGAAIGTLRAFGSRGLDVLREIAASGRLDRSRAVALASLSGELKRAGDREALAVVLGGVAVPESGPREKVETLIRAFVSPACFDALADYVGDRRSDPARCLLVLGSLAGHPAGKSPTIDRGVARALERAAATGDAALQFAGLQAAADREVPLDPARLSLLALSKDSAVRRAAWIAGQYPDGPFDARDLAVSRDPLARQAAAVGIRGRDRGWSRSKEALAVLHALLVDEDRVVRLEALRALASFRSKATIPLLIERLAVETGRLRGDARAALRSLTGRDLGLRASAWRRFWDREQDTFRVPTRSQARRALLRAAEAKKGGSRAEFYGIQIDSDRLAFVVDTSGSMLEEAYTQVTRLEVAQRELRKAIESLKDGALFHLIAFDVVPRAHEPRPSKASKASRASALREIDRLRADGGTNVHAAVRAALDVEGIDTVYLVSDGDPTVGKIIDIEALREEIARWNSVRGLVIHCVAVGQPHELLRSLAADHGGTYKVVN